MIKKTLVSFFNLPRIIKQFIFLLIDIFISVSSTFLALIISFNTIYPTIDRLDFSLLLIYSFFFIPFFIAFGFYKNVFRFSGFETLIKIISLYSIFLAFYFILIISSNFNNLPISFSFLYPMLFLFSLLVTRILPPLFISYIDINQNPTLIYFNDIKDIEKIFNNYKDSIKGFMTDDVNHVGKKINNIDIISVNDLVKFLNNKNVKTLVICKVLDNELRKKLINTSLDNGLSIKYFDLDRLIEKPIFHISDLISRNIKWNKDKISDTLNNKIILVTGAGGSIGSELARQILTYLPNKIIILDNNEYNLFKINQEINKFNLNNSKISILLKLISINDSYSLEQLFIEHSPDIVFHAAAYKHVPLLEENHMPAIKNNFLSTINLIKLCTQFTVKKFVYISSDKAVRPANIMGLTKRLSEMYIQQNFAKFLNQNNLETYIVRFGNVAGSSGSVIPIFQNQILNGGPVTVTHKDTTRYFMTISEAVGLILEVNTFKPTNNIYILNMGEAIKIIDLAKKLILLSGQNFYTDNKQKSNGIKIDISGLRPGEKLHEELVYSKNITATDNHNIFKEEYSKYIDLDIEAIIDKLKNNITHEELNNINIKIREQ